MLIFHKKRSQIDKILNKKFKDTHELHNKLKESNIYFEVYCTSVKIVFYYLKENNKGKACKLCIDNKRRVFLTQA